MNFSSVFLLALALSGAASASPVKNANELTEVLDDFGALLDNEETGKLLEEYLIFDEEFNAAVGYFFSEEFKDLLQKVEKIDDFINFYEYLEEAGLDTYALVNGLHEMLGGLPPFKPGRHARSPWTPKITGGASGFIADYKAILPVEEIKALHEEKLKTSPAFAKFVKYWTSPRFQELIDALRANEEFQKLVNIAKEHGIYVNAIADLYAANLGLEFPSRRIVKRSAEFERVWNEFFDLLPTKQIRKILEKYMQNDAEFFAAADYLFSDSFKDIVQKADGIDDVINFYHYLEEAGLNIHVFVNDIHKLLGLPPLKWERHARSVKITGGVAGFFAEFRAILPVDKIKAFHEEKLKTSPAFVRFVEYWYSPRFQEVIEALQTNEEFQKLINVVKEAGIDVDAIAENFATTLGLEIPSRRVVPRSAEFERVWNEFFDLLPTNQIRKILEKYMQNDAEFFAAADYLFSDSFKDIVQKADGIDDVINFYHYLEEAGMNIHEFVNDIHKLLGLPPLKWERHARSVKITGGVAGFFAEFRAILPVDKIKAFHEEKMKTSPAFVRFVEYWYSPRFQEVIEALQTNEEFQKLINVVKEAGIDVDAIAENFATTLGLEIPSRRIVKRSVVELENIWTEFSDLVPRKQLRQILEKYMENDAEFYTAIEYFFSDELKDLLQKVEIINDVNNFYRYLEEAGMDVHELVNDIHFLLGLPPLRCKRHARSVRTTGGVAGFFAEYKAILPIDKIEALHQKKLKTSPAFARFVGYWKSPHFQELIEALRENKEFQRLLKIAKEGGIYVNAIGDIYATMLGLEFPSIEQFQ